MIHLPTLMADLQGQRARVTVSSVITEIDPDHHSMNGARHQLFSVQITNVLADRNHTGIAGNQVVNVAVRYGDSESLPEAIPGLAVGEPITLCGAYVPAQFAYGEADGDQRAVIHFTHHPVGWVEYQGKHYE